MDKQALREAFGRRIRLGMVGGGSDSQIGAAHLIGMRVDGLYELVAGTLSVNPAIARSSAKAAYIADDRSYDDYRDMAEQESERPDGIEAVVIATPPQLHWPVARAFIEKGIHVLCEKPLTANLAEAREFAGLVASSGVVFSLNHCYSAYPMVREARALVAAGAIGAVRLVEIEGCLGFPDLVNEPADPANRHWRFRVGSMGPAAILGEVGSHHHHLIRFVTGHEVDAVSATFATIAPGREVYDNAYLSLRLSNGAVGRLWDSYVAAGNDHGLWFRVFGEKGSLTWRQEDPELLWHKMSGGSAHRLARGYDSLSPGSLAATRLGPGTPEGFGFAFANIYADFAAAIMARNLGTSYEFDNLIPTARDGLRGMGFIAASIDSHERQGAWATLATE